MLLFLLCAILPILPGLTFMRLKKRQRDDIADRMLHDGTFILLSAGGACLLYRG